MSNPSIFNPAAARSGSIFGALGDLTDLFSQPDASAANAGTQAGQAASTQVQPIVTSAQNAANARVVDTSTNWTWVILRGAVGLGAGAVVGVALAPRDKRLKYGVVGGLLGGLLGPLGIGAQALYVLSKE